MKDSFAACSPAQRERENRLYLEMMKRILHYLILASVLLGTPALCA